MEKERTHCLEVRGLRPTSKHRIEVNMARSHAVQYLYFTPFQAQESSVACVLTQTREMGTKG